MQTRKQIAEVFRQAKQHLRPAGGVLFICTAISRTGTSHAAKQAARRIVEQRLHPHNVLEYWLENTGNASLQELEADLRSGMHRIQATRHAWLDSLIDEFSKEK